MHIQVFNFPRTALMSPSLGAWPLAISSLTSRSPGVPKFLSFKVPTLRVAPSEVKGDGFEKKEGALTINVHVPRC